MEVMMTNEHGLHTGDKPCEYKFQRFLGQKVTIYNASMVMAIYGTIVDIQPYYTMVQISDDVHHGILACTPTDIKPAEPTPYGWMKPTASDGTPPRCDNCKGCDLFRHGWVCGNWQEDEERQLEMRL